MSTVSTLYGTKTNLTITCSALAASATVGRQATVVNSTTNNPLNALVQGQLTVGVVSGNKQILFYVAGSFDGGTTYTLGSSTNVIGASDAGFTRLALAGAPPALVLPCPTASILYTFAFDVASQFGGYMPDHWTVCVFNDTGVALATSGANNNSIFYKEINLTVV